MSILFRPAVRALLRNSARSALCTRANARPFHVSYARRLPPNDGGLNNILSGGEAPPVQVKTITSSGIQLADGLVLSSACIFLDGKVFMWNVPETTWDGWKPEHFEIFETVVPKPGQSYTCRFMRWIAYACAEILLIGTGDRVDMMPPALRQYLIKAGVQVDVMNTVRLTKYEFLDATPYNKGRGMHALRTTC